MSKIITSPSKHYSGSVTIADPMTMLQVMEWEEAIEKAKAFAKEELYSAKYAREILAGIFPSIEKWELVNFPELVTIDNFPGSPKAESMKLIAWLIQEISKVYREADEIPNA